MDSIAIYSAVKDRYSATALAPPSSSHAQSIAQAFGYSASELSSIPSDANLGLSCGNPLALASLKEGETVIDLGSGAGFDCFLAARKVGEKGKSIGVDMNEDMLTKARMNAEKGSITNVEFINSRITDVALPDATADVIISNCVINLVPHEAKHKVFEEAFRLLKPGGRLAVSDILAKKPFDEQMKRDIALYVGCIAGASMKQEYEEWLKKAGFDNVLVVDAQSDLNVYTRDEGDNGVSCCTPTAGKTEEKQTSCCGTTKNDEMSKDQTDRGVLGDIKTNFKNVDLNEWAGSYKIFAVKAA